MVTSWILNSLAKEISDSVEYVNDSVELWRELEVDIIRLMEQNFIKYKRRLVTSHKEH